LQVLFFLLIFYTVLSARLHWLLFDTDEFCSSARPSVNAGVKESKHRESELHAVSATKISLNISKWYQ
jgi:hypothetical protein